MAGKIENVRLRLVGDDDDDDDRQHKGCKSARPRDCCLCPAVKVCCVLVILCFLAFIAVRVVDILRVLKKKDKPATAAAADNAIPGSDFCKSVNADNMSLVALGYLNGIKWERSSLDAGNQIYYITNRLFTDQEACAIEALLRLFQDKSVFIVEIGNFSHPNNAKIDYTQFLREQYTNLNRIKSTKEMFFRGSPFQNHIKEIDSFSIFAAKVLLVWQFGGTVLSPNFILLTRRLFDNNEGFCEVDRDLLFCPNQCSAYVYELVKSVLDTLKNTHRNRTAARPTAEQLVDKSVVDYCGDPEARLVGCVGINRIKPYRVCHTPNKNCDFLRVQEWKVRDRHWKQVVQRFCPKIIARYSPDVSQVGSDSDKTGNVEYV